eukprot:TRINITY_DN6048_c1_g1_i1.p1 TRINITY_DN6048_c1_g1~~TRINITY_DN6048_c1_g1_i1.p1  ORF type:complete len:415 (+),score=105.72 TRINITY_DN6048_c1_g1_i1:125-1246(+)
MAKSVRSRRTRAPQTSLRVRREQEFSDSLRAETRGTAASDLLIILGEQPPSGSVSYSSNAVRVRTLQGMRELFTQSATPRRRRAMEQILDGPEGDGVRAEPTMYSRAEGGEAMQRILAELDREWANHSQALRDQHGALERVERQRQEMLAKAATTGDVRRGWVGELSRWQKHVAQEKRRLRLREADHLNHLSRLQRSLRRLPVIDLVRKDNAEARAVTDGLLGREYLHSDARPLAQQFPEMSIGQVDCKILALELEEGVRPQHHGPDEDGRLSKKGAASAALQRISSRPAVALSPPPAVYKAALRNASKRSRGYTADARSRRAGRPQSAPARRSSARYLMERAAGHALTTLRVTLPGDAGDVKDINYDSLFAD